MQMNTKGERWFFSSLGTWFPQKKLYIKAKQRKNDTANIQLQVNVNNTNTFKHEGKKGDAIPPWGRETPSAADQNFQDSNLGGESEKGAKSSQMLEKRKLD